jgi:hypothetical protein
LPVKVMAEGNETPGGERPHIPDGQPRRSESDLLSERRARRAAESGEAALVRRAEAAEATVVTLERHVASLQQRLREAEDEQQRMAETLELEQAAALERERELRRAKQREYAEQQLRVEAEDRLAGSDGDARAEVEHLAARLSASEDDAGALAERLEALQQQLTEAERLVDAERAALSRGEEDLRARLGALELRAAEMQRGLQDERAARERTEQMLEGNREGHRHMELIVTDMKDLVERLFAAVGVLRATRMHDRRQGLSAAGPPPAGEPQPQPQAGGPARVLPGALSAAEVPASARELAGAGPGLEMADALAAAVERLRARAEAAPVLIEGEPELLPIGPSHKHAMSLIGRVRIRRKQRLGR